MNRRTPIRVGSAKVEIAVDLDMLDSVSESMALGTRLHSQLTSRLTSSVKPSLRTSNLSYWLIESSVRRVLNSTTFASNRPASFLIISNPSPLKRIAFDGKPGERGPSSKDLHKWSESLDNLHQFITGD